jgi:tripartite ATP-independent transporter DctM subunit
MALTILCVSFTLLLLLGVPVAFSIGLSSLATLLFEGLPLAVGFQQMISGMNPFSFLAIPFFIFAGEIMMYGGIADKIVNFAKSLAGHVRGGLGMSNVLACTLFGGVSGSPVADVSAMGAVLIPQMKKEGYDADYAVNVTTHASLVGALMPTSHNLIIFTLAASGKVSIAALILAGIVPAIVLTICNLVAAYAVAVKRGYPAGTFPGWSVVGYSFAQSLPGLLVVVIIIVGILSGAFTATESASVAVIWALFLATMVYKKLTREQFLKAAAKAVKSTGAVLLLIGISSMFGYLIGLYGVAELTGQMLSSISATPWAVSYTHLTLPTK